MVKKHESAVQELMNSAGIPLSEARRQIRAGVRAHPPGYIDRALQPLIAWIRLESRRQKLGMTRRRDCITIEIDAMPALHWHIARRVTELLTESDLLKSEQEGSPSAELDVVTAVHGEKPTGVPEHELREHRVVIVFGEAGALLRPHVVASISFGAPTVDDLFQFLSSAARDVAAAWSPAARTALERLAINPAGKVVNERVVASAFNGSLLVAAAQARDTRLAAEDIESLTGEELITLTDRDLAAALGHTDATLRLLPTSLDQCTSLWPEGWSPIPDGQPPRLRIPMGKLDSPSADELQNWELDLSGRNGNLLVLGRGQSGRSTALKTFVLSTALTHTPEQVQMFLVDYTVGGLNQLAELPHVSGVASRADSDAIERIFSQVRELIRGREKLFREHKISSMDEYRARRANSNDELRSLDPYGDVFVVFDGWEAAVAEGNQLNGWQNELKGIFSGALNVGVHLVVASTTTTALRSLSGAFNSIIELKLDDYTDSRINRELAKEIPEEIPGRCLTTTDHGAAAIVALPRIDGTALEESTPGADEAHSRAIAAAYEGRRAPALKLLPAAVTVADLDMVAVPPHQLALGIRESTGEAALHNFAEDPHLLILGEPRMGKSELVAGLVRQIEDRFPTRDDAVIFLIDPQQRHLDLQRSKNVYAVSNGRADDVKEKFTALAQELNIGAREVPADLASQEERAARGWWSGPEIFIVIDDYQVASPRQPIEPPAVHEFATVIGQAYERGYHLIVARSFADVGRAQHADPVIRELLQTQVPTVILGGNWREEGVIAGVRAKSFGVPGRAYFAEPIENRIDTVQALGADQRRGDAG